MPRRPALAYGLLACAVASGCAPAHAGGAAPAPVPTSAPTAAPTTAPASAQPVAGVRWPATGALFGGPPGDLGAHFCTASVVDTPGRDVVVTAAHCVATGDGTPARTGMSFVPGYHDGDQPYGVWTVETATVDPRWQATADPARDIAFLTVTRPDAARVEDVTGGYALAVDPGPTTAVDAIGYPDFGDEPQVRSGVTRRFSPTQLELDAYGLFDGTSGGPWLRDDGRLVGVTGGHQQGGSTPAVSYACYLDDHAGALLDQVTRTS